MTLVLKHPAVPRRGEAPSSKSYLHRALIAAAFGDAPTAIVAHGWGEDVAATAAALRALGAKITETAEGFEVTPIGVFPQTEVEIFCRESASTLRFLLPVVGTMGVSAVFLRGARLAARPLAPLLAELAAHGLVAEEKGEALHVRGKLLPGAYRMVGNLSSQFITGLLFALSLLKEPSTLTLEGAVESAPYLAVTTDMLGLFGARPAYEEKGQVFHISGEKHSPFHSPRTLTIEGDYSSAAFLLAAGAIGEHPLTVSGLNPHTAQGDAAILPLLSAFGAKVEVAGTSVTVSPAPLRGITVNAAQIPDLVPVLALLGAVATGDTKIEGAARLRLKESDRLKTTAAFLKALGGDVKEEAEGLLIHGGAPLCGGTVDAAGDHRIAMSAAVASLVTKGAVVIPFAECVNKSYPAFFETVILPHKRKEQA